MSKKGKKAHQLSSILHFYLYRVKKIIACKQISKLRTTQDDIWKRIIWRLKQKGDRMIDGLRKK
jgi:hypothetical protein